MLVTFRGQSVKYRAHLGDDWERVGVSVYVLMYIYNNQTQSSMTDLPWTKFTHVIFM